MPSTEKRLLVIQCAALSHDIVQRYAPKVAGLDFKPLQAPFPGLTCPVQAAFRTGTEASEHGMVANGVYDRDLKKVLFWEQAASLVNGPRIWDGMREQNKQTAMLFWQQSLGESTEVLLSPRPIHKHSGGMIQACYSKPSGMYKQIQHKLLKGFNLMHYWGPMASAKSSAWITKATIEIMAQVPEAPHLIFSYLPHLDYDLQRFGPDHSKAAKATTQLCRFLDQLIEAAKVFDYEVLVYGDYAIEAVTAAPVYPNQVLKDHGYMAVQEVKGMQYPDLFSSRAFAMVDHQIAHVYIPNPTDISRVASLLSGVEGIADVQDANKQQQRSDRSGELLLLAKPGTWFAYPWWKTPHHAPDFAGHVDIHNKPGYDPAELFFGFPPKVCQDATRVKGTHGLVNDRPVAYGSTAGFEADSLIELSKQTRAFIM